MTGDQGSDAGGARARPSFLPPDDGYPAPAQDVGDPVPGPRKAPPRRGIAWNLAMIAAASALLVAAFLPWARVQVVVDLFGRPLTRDLGSVAGIDADDLVLAVPVLAVVAIGMALWDLAGRDARIGVLTAVPGVLALLTCGIFVLRLGRVRDDLPGGALPEDGLDVGYQVSVRYGWYLAVAAALLLTGFSLIRPLAERVLSPRGAQRPHTGEQPYAGTPYAAGPYAGDPYAADPYAGDPYAAWPQESRPYATWPEQYPDQEQDREQEQDPQQEPDPKQGQEQGRDQGQERSPKGEAGDQS
ncbi:hypothetical protein [Actinomadura rubrisoli]|uniref:Uncharacterized protein n=1 Tax=Actinomadura rubrisoli TaxID=2530368 RepID=A0A4R5BS05_9ACTN|nr:hypothetical protein [Actinomadura rubrisoli]TDD89801.1 hypothetical protein E1298_13780 [Actinomadura rubrisoli]